MPAVVIAANNLMPALRDRLAAEGDLLTFPAPEPIQALQTILEERPALIVLERLFAATPRGAALINRIKSDPQLGTCEGRVMSHTGDYTRRGGKRAPAEAAWVGYGRAGSASTATGAPGGSVATEDAPRPLDWHGTRRAPRHRVREGVEIQLDGNPATVIDLSAVGAQVISP